ncbi:protein maelstrom-like [Ceratina calcarata]|uniref:Protein maelstrom-like n=1 Tax=Ceratina calcarata TaxID=156304 RepID=A0AAJ7S691_9HYME|nr:protein maelstrom-like [Ceratina calcarata]XP_026672076.1 protein maelstrom-like [Ceratina calcarata]
MSKKIKGHNAFYYFMLNWREQQRTPNRSLKDIASDPKCTEDWKKLDPTHRGEYEALAKDRKIQAQGSINKYTTLGESLVEIEEQERQEKELIENMKKYISSVISIGLRHENLESMKYIFIHVNWFYRKQIGINKTEYGPAEFAVAEFSIKGGTENVYHEILNIPIPLGYKGEALAVSADSHQIPIDYADGQSDFRLMYMKLVSFLESNMTGNKLPPLFTTNNLKPAVDSLLLRMCDAAQKPIEDFKIYSIEVLFSEVLNAVSKNIQGESPVPIAVAILEFEKDIFAYTSGSECDFHKFLDNTAQYCSKSIVTRWGYTICDYCCKHLNVKVIEGIHYPACQKEDEASGTDVDELAARMEWLTAGKKKKKDLNGVSDSHRLKVSARSYTQEQRRREESKPLEIIDHGKISATTSSETDTERLPQRPLRLPKVMPASLQASSNTNDSSYEESFPSIGRGCRKNMTPKELRSLGRGRSF